jgi:hypothetical protein
MDDPENKEILEGFFTSKITGECYDGMCYKLYFDSADNRLAIYEYADVNSHPEDDTYTCIDSVSGYCDESNEDLFKSGINDIWDFGYAEWLDEMVYKIGMCLAEDES